MGTLSFSPQPQLFYHFQGASDEYLTLDANKSAAAQPPNVAGKRATKCQSMERYMMGTRHFITKTSLGSDKLTIA